MSKLLYVPTYTILIIWGLSITAKAVDKKPDARKRLDTILNERSAISGVYSWDFELVPLRGQSPDFASGKSPPEVLEKMHEHGLESFKEQAPASGEFTSGKVLFDCNDGRYFLLTDSVIQWAKGAAPTIAKRDRWGFDGTTYSMWTRSQHGSNLPPENISPEDRDNATLSIAEGELSDTVPSADTYRAYLSTSGASFLPPHIDIFGREPLPTRLQEFINTRISRSDVFDVKERKGGIIEISFEYPNPSPKATIPDKIVLTLDERHGGILIKVERFPNGLNHSIEEYIIEPVEWGDGVWGPAEVTYVNWLNGFGSRVKLTQRKIRHDVKADDFRVEMPIGTRVNDNVNKLTYLAADGPFDEAKAIQQYTRAHNLIQEFNSDVELTPKAKPLWSSLLIITNVAVLIGIIGVVAFRKFRKGGAPVVILTASLALSISAEANDGSTRSSKRPDSNPRAEITWDSGWTLRNGARKDIKVTQCGFNVIVLTLLMNERTFDPGRVSHELKPTVRGISMRSMKRVLESWGLDVKTRQDVKLVDLVGSMERGTLVICAVSSSKVPTVHYVALMRTRSGSVRILDPPGRIDNLSQWSKKRLESHKPVVAMFVSKKSNQPAFSTQVSIEPALVVVDYLASFDASTDDKVATIPVKFCNNSAQPVALAKLMFPCGCMSGSSVPVIIEAHSTAKCDLKIYRDRWGKGQKKVVTVLFGDGSVSTIPVELRRSGVSAGR